jgi:hypothetical protein
MARDKQEALERQRQIVHDYANRQRMAELVKPPKPSDTKAKG